MLTVCARGDYANVEPSLPWPLRLSTVVSCLEPEIVLLWPLCYAARGGAISWNAVEGMYFLDNDNIFFLINLF